MNSDLHRFNLASALIAASILAACGGGQSSSGREADPTASSSRDAVALADTTWVRCASEGGACVFTGTRQVRYGTTTKYATKTFTSSAACDNSVFGDPAYGITKQCWYASESASTPAPPATSPTTPSTTSWKLCAYEGSTCTFSGSRQVRYGTTTQTVTRTHSDKVLCGNTTFGDPAYGIPKMCWVAEQVAAAPAPAPAPAPEPTPAPTPAPAPSTGGVPTPDSIAGKRLVGRIDAVNGQVIENVHVTTTKGPCIVVPSGVTNVTIRNSEIGPCGSQDTGLNNEGVYIAPGASNVTIARNVIHDVSAGVFAAMAKHPIVIDRNFIYNVRGPMWQGELVQFNGVRGGTGSSKVTCNINDGRYSAPMAVGRLMYSDHISMYNTLGNGPNAPIEIAYNRIRGAWSNGTESGSGMQLGDSPAGGGGAGSDESGWYNVHHNTIVNTNGVAIAVSGGHDISISNNRSYNRGENLATMTGWNWSVKKFDPSPSVACYNINWSNNRSVPARLWAFNRDGQDATGIFNYQNVGSNACSYTESGNNHNDSSITAAIFDEPYPECN